MEPTPSAAGIASAAGGGETLRLVIGGGPTGPRGAGGGSVAGLGGGRGGGWGRCGGGGALEAGGSAGRTANVADSTNSSPCGISLQVTASARSPSNSQRMLTGWLAARVALSQSSAV